VWHVQTGGGATPPGISTDFTERPVGQRCAEVASRFGVVVTQKLAAQAVPVIGAIGGAAVELRIEVARAHFTLRRLERNYGKDTVRAAYERFRREAA